MVTDDLRKRVEVMTASMLDPERLRHSIGVAELSKTFCIRYGLDPRSGWLAGYAHDMCKNLRKDERRELASRFDNFPLRPLENDKVTHGPAAAVMLRDLGVEDDDILEAVAYHTIGKPDMCSLSKVVYCADKLEGGRERVAPEFREKVIDLGLDELVGAVVENLVAYLETSGMPVASETVIMRERYSAARGMK